MESGLLPSLLSLSEPPLWVILMQAGGHFAGAVFSGSVSVCVRRGGCEGGRGGDVVFGFCSRSSVLAHKTFHRYTVRAKRGTTQSARDSQSGGHGPR